MELSELDVSPIIASCSTRHLSLAGRGTLTFLGRFMTSAERSRLLSTIDIATVSFSPCLLLKNPLTTRLDRGGYHSPSQCLGPSRCLMDCSSTTCATASVGSCSIRSVNRVSSNGVLTGRVAIA